MGRRAFDAQGFDLTRREALDTGVFKLAFAMGDVDGGFVHVLGLREADDIVHELAGFLDVENAVLFAAAWPVTGAEGDNRRLVAHSVEKTIGCEIMPAVGADTGNPPDRAR